jgi:hypothetical protein
VERFAAQMSLAVWGALRLPKEHPKQARAQSTQSRIHHSKNPSQRDCSTLSKKEASTVKTQLNRLNIPMLAVPCSDGTAAPG